MDHGALAELAAGAALDDLEPAERAALDAHLASCSSCQALVADLDEVLADLALAAPELQPPASLRGDVLDGLRAASPPDMTSPQGGRPATIATLAVRPARRDRAAAVAALGLAAVLGVVAIGFAARTVQLTDEVAGVTAALAATERRTAEEIAAMRLVTDPAHVAAALQAESVAPAASAVVLYRPGAADAYLLASGLPSTPDGQVYQLWWADASGVHALGTFSYDGEGPLVAPFGVDLADGTAAMVTLEPAGGATGEPGPQVVFGEL